MGRYLIKRLLLLLPTLVGVTILASLLVRMLPAGIVDIVLADLGYGHTEADRQRVARELGIARSTLFKRLKDWGLTKQDEAE